MIKRFYERITVRWRLAFGVPFLVFSVLLTIVGLATGEAPLNYRMIGWIVIIWTAGFVSRGITDAIAEHAPGIFRDLEL